jgi:hypothetical protein
MILTCLCKKSPLAEINRINVVFDADGSAGLGGAVLLATVQNVALSSADIQTFEVS